MLARVLARAWAGACACGMSGALGAGEGDSAGVDGDWEVVVVSVVPCNRSLTASRMAGSDRAMAARWEWSRTWISALGMGGVGVSE